MRCVLKLTHLNFNRTVEQKVIPFHLDLIFVAIRIKAASDRYKSHTTCTIHTSINLKCFNQTSANATILMINVQFALAPPLYFPSSNYMSLIATNIWHSANEFRHSIYYTGEQQPSHTLENKFVVIIWICAHISWASSN